MAWEPFNVQTKAPAYIGTGIGATLSKRKNSRRPARLSLSFNKLAIDALGLKKNDRFRVVLGSAEHHGLIRLVPVSAKDADKYCAILQERKFGRSSAIWFQMDLGAIETLVDRAEQKRWCQWEKLDIDQGIEIVLPSWADETRPRLKTTISATPQKHLPAAPTQKEPAAIASSQKFLKDEGDRAERSRENKRLTDKRKAFKLADHFDLTDTQARMLEFLARTGTAEKEVMHAALDGDDPNGGPDPKILDVQLSRMRPVLAHKGINIETRHGGHLQLEQGALMRIRAVLDD